MPLDDQGSTPTVPAISDGVTTMSYMQFTADVIRACIFARLVLPDMEAGRVSFTIGEVHDWLPYVQQQQVLGAAAARSPLAAYGITATFTGGFHANRDQEVIWEWNPGQANRCYQALDAATRAAIDRFVRPDDP